MDVIKYFFKKYFLQLFKKAVNGMIFLELSNY